MNFFKGIFGGQEEKPKQFDQNTKVKPSPDGRTSIGGSSQSPSQDGPISGVNAHNFIPAPVINSTSQQVGEELTGQEEEDDMFQDMEVKGEEKKPEILYQPPKIEIKQEPKLKIESPEISNLHVMDGGKGKKNAERSVVQNRRGNKKNNENVLDSPIKDSPIRDKEAHDEKPSTQVLDLLDFSGMEILPKRTAESEKLLSLFDKEDKTMSPAVKSDPIVKKTPPKSVVSVVQDSTDSEHTESDIEEESIVPQSNNFQDSLESFKKKKNEIFSKIQNLTIFGQEILSSKKQIMNELEEIKKQLTQKQLFLDDLNKRIAEFTASENFEAAEELNDQLVSKKSEIDKLKEKLTNCKSRLKSVEKDKDSLPETILATHKQFLRESDDLLEQQQEVIKTFLSEMEIKLETESDRIKSEESRLTRDSETNQIDLKSVTTRISKIQNQVKDSTKNEKKVKDDLDKSIGEVKREIDELEKKLKEKRKEMTKLEKSRKEVEDKISEGEKKFEKQLGSLKLEEEQVLARNATVLQKQNRIKIDVENFNKEKGVYEKDKSLQESIIKDIKSQIKLSKKSIQKVEKQKEILSKLRREKVDDKEIKKLKKKKEVLESEQSVIENNVFQVDAKSDVLNAKLKGLAEKVVKLTNDKKLAVSVRDFKKAQNIQNEIKEATTSEETLKSDLVVVESDKVNVYSQLGDKKKQVEKISKEMNEKEREMDLKLYRDLYKREYVLNKLAKQGEILELEHSIALLEMKDLENKLQPKSEEVNKIRELVEKDYDRDFDSQEDSETEEEDDEEDVKVVPVKVESPEVVQEDDDHEEDRVVEPEVQIQPVTKVVVVPSVDFGKLNKDLEELGAKKVALEDQLNKAIAEEQFDLCDDLNEKITNIEKEIQELEEKRGSINVDQVQDVEEEVHVVVNDVNPVETVEAVNPDEIKVEETKEVQEETSAFDFMKNEDQEESTQVLDVPKEEEEQSSFDFMKNKGTQEVKTETEPEETTSAFEFMKHEEHNPEDQPQQVPEDQSAFEFIKEDKEEETQ